MPIALESTLSPADVRAASRSLRAAGLHLPRVGWSLELPEAARAELQAKRGSRSPPRRIVHDAHGYFYIY